MTTTETSTQADHTNPPEKASSTPLLAWHRIALGVILLISAFLNFFQLEKVGYGNGYYAAGVKSMILSWHNFFFVSFDPGGFVTIDKPPLGFWIQAASARLLGFSGQSLLFPEALAGVLCVALLYYLVARIFGQVPGLIAALALALSPISVATSRNNTIDMLLVLTVLLATWALSRATETGRLRWLLLSVFFVGLGFNIKMLEAYLIIPAFGLVYLLSTPQRWYIRVAHLALATVVLLVISFSWVMIVDLTPASQRPYAGSSGINSELNLALGYNGLARLTGRNPPSNGPSLFQQLFNLSGEGNAPGLLRLLDQQEGGQVGWLLPMALLGLLAVGWQRRPRIPLPPQQQALVLWGVWFFTMTIFFSVAGFFHIYYMVMLVPGICVLFAIGLGAMWQDYRRPGWRGWFLPVALIATALVQAHMLSYFPDQSRWLTPIIVALCLFVAVILIMVRLFVHLTSRRHQETPKPTSTPTTLRPWFSKPVFLNALATTGVLALLLAPTVWDGFAVALSSPTADPLAGPHQQSNAPAPKKPGRMPPQAPNVFALEQYLLTNQGQVRFLVATINSGPAIPIILDTDQPVMALGGFGGGDRILTIQQLITLVDNGTVRFFLFNSGLPHHLSPRLRKRFQGSKLRSLSGTSNNDLMTWVSTHCASVPISQWQAGSPLSDINNGTRLTQELFDCAIHG